MCPVTATFLDPRRSSCLLYSTLHVDTHTTLMHLQQRNKLPQQYYVVLIYQKSLPVVVVSGHDNWQLSLQADEL